MRISDWSSDVCSSDLGYREGERHREADVPGVKHRRVKGEPGILQQGIEIVAVGRWREHAQERVGGEHREGEKAGGDPGLHGERTGLQRGRSEEHTSELQSLMRISYAVFCLKKKKSTTRTISQLT